MWFKHQQSVRSEYVIVIVLHNNLSLWLEVQSSDLDRCVSLTVSPSTTSGTVPMCLHALLQLNDLTCYIIVMSTTTLDASSMPGNQYQLAHI